MDGGRVRGVNSGVDGGRVGCGVSVIGAVGEKDGRVFVL